MDKKYVIVCENNSISQPMNRVKAINMAKEYGQEGKKAYIVTKEEGERIKKSGKFYTPEWE
ncbi:MAG: hypothetical protein N4A68_02035 [Maledivibacter sp.]|nr:hypothetical protein [Maledivibacter sp.]